MTISDFLAKQMSNKIVYLF